MRAYRWQLPLEPVGVSAQVQGPLSRGTLPPGHPHKVVGSPEGISRLAQAQLQQGLAASQGLVAGPVVCQALQLLKVGFPSLIARCEHLQIHQQDLKSQVTGYWLLTGYWLQVTGCLQVTGHRLLVAYRLLVTGYWVLTGYWSQVTNVQSQRLQTSHET